MRIVHTFSDWGPQCTYPVELELGSLSEAQSMGADDEDVEDCTRGVYIRTEAKGDPTGESHTIWLSPEDAIRLADALQELIK